MYGKNKYHDHSIGSANHPFAALVRLVAASSGSNVKHLSMNATTPGMSVDVHKNIEVKRKYNSRRLSEVETGLIASLHYSLCGIQRRSDMVLNNSKYDIHSFA